MAKKHEPNSEPHPEETSSNGTAPTSEPESIPPTPEAPKAATKPTELLGKIVAKNIVGRKELVYVKGDDGKVVKDEPRLLYRVWGVAQSLRRGNTTYGDFVGFQGNFKALRFSDGQLFQAPECFLQGASEQLLDDALTTAQKKDPSASVRFMFDIGVKPSAKWVTEDKGNSYEYTIRTVMESEQHDPLEGLNEIAMKSLPQLPSPQ